MSPPTGRQHARRARSPLDLRVSAVGGSDSEVVPASAAMLAGAIGRAAARDVQAVLILDAEFPDPDESLVARLLSGPADVWHAGVALGLDGQPAMWAHVDPVSMFSARVDPTIEVTSWRLSLRATLVRAAVIEQLGGPDSGFDTLTGAALDAGLRWIRAGALVRHVPQLVPQDAMPDASPTARDGLRLVTRHRGRTWGGWALQRGVLSGEVRPHELPSLVRYVAKGGAVAFPDYEPPGQVTNPDGLGRTVSVIVPTVDRYPYLIPLLGQLAAQTVAPHEVVIVDQTPVETRRHDLAEVEPDLPVRVLEIAKPGQSTARNAAIRASTGEMLLFIDDDDEIQPTLIADHLERLIGGVDAVSGAVDDATAGPPPPGFRHRRASDVFPTNNTLLRRSALEGSGMFDPVFDRGSRADHDLGMRLHLAGATLVYDPSVEVYHHHAPVGGLRTHGARKITRASARRSVTERNLPSITELYLTRKYFTDAQRKESRRITLLSMLGGDGTAGRRLARAATQMVLLPSTGRRLRQADRQAQEFFESAPPTPGVRRQVDGGRQ